VYFIALEVPKNQPFNRQRFAARLENSQFEANPDFNGIFATNSSCLAWSITTYFL